MLETCICLAVVARMGWAVCNVSLVYAGFLLLLVPSRWFLLVASYHLFVCLWLCLALCSVFFLIFLLEEGLLACLLCVSSFPRLSFSSGGSGVGDA